MCIFVAGASGAIGSRLLPRLVAAGHSAVGLTRLPAKVEAIPAAGGGAAVGDALDRAAIVTTRQSAGGGPASGHGALCRAKLLRMALCRAGGAAKSEGDPLDRAPPRALRPTLAAIRYLEERVTASCVPLIGDADGWWSFLHIDAAAAVTTIAIERGRAGIYNIVDDEPAPVREWLPALAAMLGAKPPRKVPKWLARIAAGEHS